MMVYHFETIKTIIELLEIFFQTGFVLSQKAENIHFVADCSLLVKFNLQLYAHKHTHTAFVRTLY